LIRIVAPKWHSLS